MRGRNLKPNFFAKNCLESHLRPKFFETSETFHHFSHSSDIVKKLLIVDKFLINLEVYYKVDRLLSDKINGINQGNGVRSQHK